MTTPIHRTPALTGLLAVLALAGLAATLPGGFQLKAERTSGTAYEDAALIIRTYRCHEPHRAEVRATAEGLVDGRRVSRPLTLRPVDSGVYTLSRQWPSEGRWIVAVQGEYLGHESSLLIALNAEGEVILEPSEDAAGLTPRAQTLHRNLRSGDIDQALLHLTAASTR